jgi:hypothetical protein
VITGELKGKIDRIWDAFWSGGISNPLEVIEQITYLLFIRRLDDLQTLKERKANRIGKPIEDPIFQPGQELLRWSHFKDREPGVMHNLVFPLLRQLGADGSTYSEHMKDARSPSRPRRCSLASSTCSMTFPRTTGTRTATSTSTCLARSPRLGRTASSARLGTSSS